MAAKQTTSVSLTPEQRQAIDDVRQRLAVDGEVPSRNAVMRAALTLGLPLVGQQGRRIAG